MLPTPDRTIDGKCKGNRLIKNEGKQETMKKCQVVTYLKKAYLPKKKAFYMKTNYNKNDAATVGYKEGLYSRKTKCIAKTKYKVSCGAPFSAKNPKSERRGTPLSKKSQKKPIVL